MLITGGLTIDARIPGICAIFGRSALMTSSTDKCAFGPRLQLDVHAPLIGALRAAAEPDLARKGEDIRVLREDFVKLLLVPDHLLECRDPVRLRC